MRQIVARRIHGFMKSAGPTMTFRKARDIWFAMPKYQVGATHPKFSTLRFRKNRMSRPMQGGSYHYANGRRVPIRMRNIYHHNVGRFAHPAGHRPDRGYGKVCMAMHQAALVQAQLALKLNLQAVARREHMRKPPKVYPSFSTRAMSRGVGRGR